MTSPAQGSGERQAGIPVGDGVDQGAVSDRGLLVDPNNAATTAERRHGTDLTLRCNQCGTGWQYSSDAPTQCPDCLDHLGELIDPAHPDWCMKNCGCIEGAGHDGPCNLVGPLPSAACLCQACVAERATTP